MNTRNQMQNLITREVKEAREHVDAAIANMEYLLGQLREASHQLNRVFHDETVDLNPSDITLRVVVQHSKTDMRIPQLTALTLTLAQLQRQREKAPIQ